jgi:hypothetical protein
MKLIYRAHTYEYTPPVQSYVKPCALNLRFQPSGKTWEFTPHSIQPYLKLRALNWRFQARFVT